MKGKFTFKKLTIFVTIVCLITLITNIFATRVIKNTSTIDNGKEYLKKVVLPDGVGGTEVTLNTSYSNQTTSFPTDAKSFVKVAISKLGTPYVWAGKGGLNGWDASGLDCSGLVAYSLINSGYTISGFNIDSKNENYVPMDANNWLEFTQGGYKGNTFYEVGLWTRAYSNVHYGFERLHNETYAKLSSWVNGLKFKVDRNEGKVNILKVNDPITDDLRWYQYYDSNGNLKELPAGAIVISNAKGVEAYGTGHAWIALGNLGTSDVDEAVEIINKTYGTNISSSAKNSSGQSLVYSAGSSEYWFIEASDGGVKINNSDPDYWSSEQIKTSDGKYVTKKIGSIWAFQVAGDVTIPKTGGYHMYVTKQDYDTGSVLGGAEFTINQTVDGVNIGTGSYTSGNDKVITKDGDSSLIFWERSNNVTKKTASNNFSEVEIKQRGSDIYEITEIKAPNGYTILNNTTLKLQVNKIEKSGKTGYEIDSIEIVGVEGSKVTAPANAQQNIWLRLDKNGNVTTDENNYWVAIDFHRGDSGAINVRFKDEKVKYSLDIDKIDATTEKYIADAKFNVNYYKNTRVEDFDNKMYYEYDDSDSYEPKAKLSWLTSSEWRKDDNDLTFPTKENYDLTSLGEPNGGSKITSTGVSNPPLTFKVDNSVDKRDIIEISEVSAPEGYAKVLSKPVILAVHKTNSGTYETDANGNYKLNALELLDQDGRSLSPAIKISEGEFLNIGENGQRDDENPVVKISFNGNKISAKWYNKSIVGSYALEFGKTSKSNLGTYVAGVRYEYTSKINGVQNQPADKVTETSSILLENVNIDGNKLNESDIYSFKEKNVGDNKFKVKDYTSTLTVHRTTDSEKKNYIVDYVLYKDTKSNVSIRINKGKTAWIFEDGSYKTNPTDSEKQEAIAYVDYSDGKTIIFVDIDEDEKPFDFKLFKTADGDGEALNNTKFTIKRHKLGKDETVDLTKAVGGEVTDILNDQSLSTKANNQIDYVDPRGKDKYVYEIHETNTEAGYINVFKKNDKEIAYIQLMVYEDESGNLKAEQGIVTTSECTSDDLAKINTYVKSPEVNGNSVTLNILNQKNDLTFTFEKYSKGTSGNTLLKEGDYLVKIDGVEISSEDKKKLSDDGTATIKVSGVSVGEHTIEFYEKVAPTNFENVFDLFKNVDGIIAKIIVNEDGTTSLVENTVSGTKYRFFPADENGTINNSEIAEISKYADANLYDGNNINLKIYDPSSIKFTLHKMLYNGENDVKDSKPLPSNATANFEITRTSPTQEKKFSGDIPTNTQTTFFTEDKVFVGSTYKYNVIEKDISAKYYRDLIDKNIEVSVKMGANGKITSAGYNIKNVDAATNAELRKLISIEHGDNSVDLYIANVPEDFYKVMLHKVDKYGHQINYPATFDVTHKGETRKIPLEGLEVISEDNATVEYNSTQNYIIEEENPPAGYDPIEGRVELDIEFNGMSDSKAIKSATATYYDKDGNKSTKVGAYARVRSNSAIVDVYIPNESSKPYEFKVIKYANDGKTKLVSDADGKGASFDIQRMLDTYEEFGTDGKNKFDYHEAQAIIDAGAGSLGTIFTGVLEDGEIIDSLPLGGGFIYRYFVTETETKSNYINILKGKQIQVEIKGGYENRNTVITSYEYKVYDISDPTKPSSECTEEFNKEYPNCINLSKETNSDGIEVVSLGITNPKGYKVRINKTDTDGNPVNSAVIEAYHEGERAVTMNIAYDYSNMPHIFNRENTVTSSESYAILPGTEQTWKIYERRVDSPYYNVFGLDKYIEVKVTMDDQGNLSTGYDIKNEDGSKPSDYNTLKKYIKKVDILTKDEETNEDLDEPIVRVVIENPKIYRLRITKYEMDGKTELSGATVTLKKEDSDAEETIISNGQTYYETYDFSKFSTTHVYEIKEIDTADKYHVNVLEGKKIKLWVRTANTGTITRSYRIYNEDGTENSDLRKYVVLGDITIGEDGTSLVPLKILNPKTGSYNVKIVKTDESGTPIKKYPATFSYSRYNSKVNKVDDKDDNVKTNNNGQATIASNKTIDEEGQKFNYTINEKEAPLGYELYEGTINLNLTSIDDKQKLTIDKEHATLSVDGENIDRLTTNKASYAKGKSAAWYFDDSSDSATITIYVKNTKKEFDLALRKHIENVSNSRGKNKDYTRGPVLNNDSLEEWKDERTAAYYHTKEAVGVETGDIVRYRIDIFNEAFLKGYATEITDYLQEGLEFAENSSINNHYGWKFYDASGKETTDMSKATYAKTDYLKDTLLNEFQLQEYLNNVSQTTWHAYVEVECKVVKKPTEEKIYLTNRAEITDHKAVEFDKNGNEIVLTEKDAETEYPKDRYPDRDSQIENVKEKYGSEMLNYNRYIRYYDDKYYPGYQDDDDKETVTIEAKKEYEFKLIKTDGEGNEIDGAKFKVEEKVDGEYKTVYGGENGSTLNKSMTLSEPEASGKDTVKLNTTYEYKITELDSDVENFDYENLLKDKYIIVNAYMNESGNLVKGTYGTNNYLMNKYGFTIYNAKTNSALSERSSILYSRIKVEPDNSTNPPTLKVTIPNDEIITGQYRINLKKVDKSGNAIEGIPFTVNTEYEETDSSGLIDVSKSYEDIDGYVFIDKNTVNRKETYQIEEVEKVDEETGEVIPTGYVMIAKPITLTVTKGLDASKKNYMATNILVEYTGAEGEQTEPLSIDIDPTLKTGNGSINVLTKDGTTVPVDITVSTDGTITIKAENDTKDGKYKLRIYKKYQVGTGVSGPTYEALSGAEFKVTGEKSNPTTGSNGYTRFIEREIKKETLNDPDVFEIEEIKSGKTGVVGLKYPLKLYVTKTETNAGYEINTLQIEDTGTGKKSDIVNGEGTYAILNDVAIDDVARDSDGNVIKDENGNVVYRTIQIRMYGAYNNQITVEIANLPKNDVINVKIKKINSKNGEALNGVSFKSVCNNTFINNVTTADISIDGKTEKGIAYLDQNRMVSGEESFTYIISETGVPSTPENLIQLTDFGWILNLKTKYDESKRKYVIDEDKTTVRVNILGANETDAEKRARQQEIAERVLEKDGQGNYKNIKISEDGATITLTIENEQTTDYGLTIRKADMDTNEELADAKFTIKEDGKTIAENQTIAEFKDKLASKTGVLVNTTHTYQIYEIAPATDYQNILENVYIELVITIDENGNAAATYAIKATENGTDKDVESVEKQIQEYIDGNDDVSKFLESSGNYFKLNIPNPKDSVPVSADLIKFETGDENKKVNNAEFSVRKTTFKKGENSGVASAIVRFRDNNSVDELDGIYTKAYATNWIEKTFDAEFGEVYYYELTETDTPKNYESKFYQALIKVFVRKDAEGNNEAVATIEKIKLTEEDTSWIDYNETEYGSLLGISVTGTNIQVKWANTLKYNFRIQKKSYNGAIPEGGPSAIEDNIGGANVTIKSSNKNATLVDGLIHETELYTEEDVHSNTMYTYTINEIEAPSEHYNIFKDIDIIANVYVGQNGVLSQANSSVTVRAKTENVSEDVLKEARDSVAIKIDTATNTATVYIANKQIHSTYDIKILKVSDQYEEVEVVGSNGNITKEKRYKGIPGIKFTLMGNQQEPIGDVKQPDGKIAKGYGYTGEDGTLTITGLKPNDFRNTYAIAEDANSANAAGVTPLYGWIYLKADMTGVSEGMTEEEVAELLSDSSRFSVDFTDNRDAANGTTVSVEGRTILITIKNRTTDMIFNLAKNDPAGTRLYNDQSGPGAEFKVVYENDDKVLVDDELISGSLRDYRHSKSNSWYEYTVTEKATKTGFINVLEGYDVRVHITTDSKGIVIDPSDESNRTYFTIIPKGERTNYSVEEILENEWVKLSVNYRTEKDEDTGEDVVRASDVTLTVINPYEYKVQLNKKDKNGSTPIKVATVTAENVVGCDVSKIYNEGTLDERDLVLKQIAKADTNPANKVYVKGTAVLLQKQETRTSYEYQIDLQGRYARYDNEQTWRITEIDVDAPYQNILKDKYVIVNTYFNDELQVAKHTDADNLLHDFYVVDKEGNNVTLEYEDYVEVSTEKINNEWTLVVTVKDPMLMYLSIYKDKGNKTKEPLSGANVKVEFAGETAEIKDGASDAGPIIHEFALGETVYATVTEDATVKGYKNILKDKTLIYAFRNEGSRILKSSILLDNTTGAPITGNARDEVMKYISLEETTTEEGYIFYKIRIDNPISFKFDLTKLDIAKNLFEGARIEVYSSHTETTHYLDGESNMSFVEEDVGPHEVITYQIREIHTSGDPYINKFSDPIRITVFMDDGEVTISKKEIIKQHGGEFDELEYFKCYVTPEHRSGLGEEEMQTIVVEMENPPQIEVELIKTTAGSEENKRPIGHTKFTIVSQDSHTAYTNYSEGKINYLEEIHEPGVYTVRVYEDEVADPKYVNILENKYMAVNINVYADGSIISGTPVFYRKDNDAYYDNDELITGEEAIELAAHCTVDVDRTGDIQKLVIHIDDPVKFDIDLTKQSTDSETLEGAEFEIESVDGLFETIRTTTDDSGKIAKRIEMADPGVYEFHVTEIKPAGTQYDNVLGKENMIVVFVKVAENGEISLVADKDGNEFTNSQTYLVKKKDGTAASAEDEKVIREFCTVKPVNNSDGPDGIAFVIENPVQTKVDIIKRQYSSDGNNEEYLDGTRFTVIKNSSDMLLNNALVDEEIEIEEHNKKASDKSYYDIYETRTNADGAYVNILYNRYIRVYTELRGDGRLIVNNDEGEASANYFEIYENQHTGPAKKLDRDQYSELYSYIDVWAERNYDGVYTLNVKVLNPITMKVGVLKKQYDPNGAAIPNVSVTVISENTGDHNITTKTYEEEFSEGYIKPGTYDFIVKEKNNPNPRYVNILKDRYAKANVTVAKDGQLTCNNIKFYTDNKNDDYTDDALITDRETLSFLQEMVYAEIDDSQVIQKIRFVIENPVTLKFVIHKLDLDEEGLNGATFDIMKYVGDSDEVAKGLTGKDTDSDGNNDGIITFEDGDIMKAGVYRYEITELKPAEEKYVNILDCYDDGSQYKVVVYVKLNLDGTTAIVKDAAGTAFRSGEQYKYKIVNRNDASAEIPSEVTEIVHKYLTVRRTASTQSESDKIDVDVHNTPMIDIDVIKVTKEDGVEKPLAGTMFSAEADDGKGLFEDIPATQDKEYTFKNVTPGPHEFYITESQGVVNGGYINVLEDRYVKVYTTISADGVMKITDNNGNEDEDYFEIYDGQYNNRSRSRFLDRTEYAKIYECVSVEAVKQENGVYKLNLKVNNPERNFKVVLNKQVFGEEDINMRDVEFFIVSSVDNEIYSLETDVNGNVSFEEKRVPVGIYKYLVTETNPSGDEFVNILEKNYILVLLQVNQDGTINLVDANGVAEGNENRYYILDEKAAQNVDFDDTIVDDFVRVETKEGEKMPELNFYIKDPERYNFKLVKRDVLTNENMNGVTFTTKVYGPDDKPVQLVDAETFEKLDISTVTTANIDGMDGVIIIPNILIDKTGTYTYVFHEESTDGLFKYLYKSHAEDITVKIDISVETDSEGKAIGYKVGQPNIVTGAKYIDDESTLTTQKKAQLVRAEVLNAPIRGNYDLVLNKLDSYTKHPLDGAEFDIVAEKDGEKFELYEDVDDLRIENAIIPDHFTVSNGELRIKNIRITPPPYQAPAEDGTLETFKIILTETKAPKGYMLLDDPIVIEVTTAIDGKDDDAKYVVKSVNLLSGENHGLVTQTHTSNEINIVAKEEYFDLALRKSITSVAYSDSDDAKITEDETENRQPKVYEDDELFDLNPDVTTAKYRHVKNHVRVYAGQEVIYTLRVYNEGEIDGYAEEITDHLPEGLEFLPTDKFNTDRGWTYDLNDQSLRTVKTTFLSKENNPNNDRFNAENNLLKALDASTGVIDYKEIEIKCKVSDNLRPGVILTNIVEITDSKAEGRTSETVDRDSVTNNADIPEGKELQDYKEDELTDNREDYVPGQEDDDDFEKLIVEEFDLALRKYITAINEDEVLADKTEEKFTDKVIENTEDILGEEGTASDDAEGTNEGANTNNDDESESANGNTKEVNDQDTDEKSEENEGTDEESEKNIDNDNTIKYDREPRVNVSTLKSGDKDSIYKDPDEPTTAKYEHTKAPVEVSVGDIVTYTLEVFNEGTVDGYASLIKDDIPEGVEFVQYTVGDGSVNDIYRWKMVDENDEEVTDPKKAKYIISDYLSKDNEKEEFANLIRAFDPETGTRLDSKYVQVQFRVICKQDYPKIITNYAQISEDTDESGKEVKDRDSTTNVWIEGEDDQDIEHIWVTYMDLALRKFITGVTDFKTGVTQVVDTRIPQVDPTALINETGTTAKYEHTKEPVLVHTNDVVIYTLRIFNEGSKDGYATQIKDDLPDGLEYLPDHEINKYYEWTLVDKNDKPVTRLEDAEYAVTNYLSKDNETKDRQNLIKSFDYYDYENDKPAKRETPEYKDIKIAFKVTEPQTSDRILINEAQISEQTDGSGVHREDRDSHPNEWLGEDDEDIEKVRVQYFDLALRKWVTKAIVTQDGKETVFETGHHAEDDPEDVVKVDLKKSKINKVVVKFEYQIRITNEGEIEGYAKEIKDHIPEGLTFDPADNPTWTQLEEDIIVTDELKDTLLKPGESAEVTVVLRWINSGDNLGIKVNIAEISKDYNDYGTRDIDSTPDNFVAGEDDIDDAPVMLAVKTGNAVIGYVLLAVFVGAIVVIGARRIKKINEG